MKALSYFLFFASVFIFCSCEKENESIENTDPKIDALFDGSYDGKTGQLVGYTEIFRNGAQIRLPFKNTVQFYIEDFVVGKHQLGGDNFNEVIIKKLGVTDCCFSSYTSDTVIGFFNIMKINEVDKTFSGTFEFTIPSIKNTGNLIEVTSGHFSNISFTRSLEKNQRKSKINFTVNGKKYFSWENSGNNPQGQYDIFTHSTLGNILNLRFPENIPPGKSDVQNLEDFRAYYNFTNSPIINTSGFLDVEKNDAQDLIFDFEIKLELESGDTIFIKEGHCDYIK